MKNYVYGLVFYVMFGAAIVGFFLWVHTQHPNHTEPMMAWFFGLVIPILPAYILIDQLEIEDEKEEEESV